jgi:hypothetical protein
LNRTCYECHDSAHGFDHIAGVLSVSPLLFEHYLAATVIPDPMPPDRIGDSTGRPALA